MASIVRKFSAASLIVILAATTGFADEVALATRPAPPLTIPGAPTVTESNPKILISVSRRILAPMFEREVTRNTDINDQILNSRVIAKSETQGQIELEMIPSSDGAIFDVVLNAESVAKGAAVNPWIRVPNIARTTLSARCRIHFDGTNFVTQPAEGKAESKVQVLGMQPSPQGRFRQRVPERTIERFGWRQTNRTLAQREEIGEQKAVERLEKFLNEEIAAELKEAEFPKRLATALKSAGLSGENVTVSCTSDALHLAIHVPDADALVRAKAIVQPAIESFPDLGEHCDIAVRLHESAVDRLGFRMLAGAILNQSGLTRNGTTLFARNKLPIPVSLTFDDEQPICVRFADGHLELCVNSNQFAFANTVLPGFGLTTCFELETCDGGVRTKLVRAPSITSEGPIGWPSVFKTMIETMVAKQVANRMLKTSFQIKKLGEPSLRAISMVSQSGCLTMSWTRTPAAPPIGKELVADKTTPREFSVVDVQLGEEDVSDETPISVTVLAE